jgi:hypothetical protein
VDREVKIWMNNPLRYAGMTFYQADFDKRTEALTVLQVVKNPSWMAPYVGCMFVLIGMVAHFGLTLSRFLERQSDDTSSLTANRSTTAPGAKIETNGRSRKHATDLAAQSTGLNWAVIVPALVVLVFGGYLLSKARMPKSKATEMQIYEFGKLPVQYQGRVKPYDTLARNTLQYLSGRQEVIREGADGKKYRTPAIRWLLDTLSGLPSADDHRIFRIENLEVLDTLGLEPRAGAFRYSLNDFRDELGELIRQAQLAAAVPDEEQSVYQRRVVELFEKLNLYVYLQQGFRLPRGLDRQQVDMEIARQHAAKMPLAIPPMKADVHWLGLMEASAQMLFNREASQPIAEGTVQIFGLLDAYAKDTAA